jgi:hypothetical protein
MGFCEISKKAAKRIKSRATFLVSFMSYSPVAVKLSSVVKMPYECSILYPREMCQGERKRPVVVQFENLMN